MVSCLKKLGKGNFGIGNERPFKYAKRKYYSNTPYFIGLRDMKDKNGAFAIEALRIRESLVDSGFGSRAGEYQNHNMNVKDVADFLEKNSLKSKFANYGWDE